MKLLTPAVLLTTVVASLSLVALSGSYRGLAQAPGSKTEEIEWTWEIRPEVADPRLPNVLLLGDSITKNYFPEVRLELKGVANVYLMASSTSVGDPRMAGQLEEFERAEGITFSVVHFNNGMHGWTYSEAEYKAAFPDFLAEIRKIAPKAKLIWATTTPVKEDKQPGPTNARVVARNGIAQEILRQAGIAVDDQHGLMLQHAETYSDDVHFNQAGSAIQGKQAVGSIREALGKK